MKQVTIQGEPGCFHEEAARRYFGDEPIEIVPCRTFEAQFERMRHEGSLLGIVAIENTIAGSLLQNHELLRRSESQIIGECKLRISHVLAALPGQRLDELSEVNSHPIALMQCGEFLKAHPQLKAVERDATSRASCCWPTATTPTATRVPPAPTRRRSYSACRIPREASPKY